MPQASVEAIQPELAREDLTTLEAMASMACQTASVVHVVVARRPGLIDRAHAFAQFAGVGVSVDAMANTVRVRFDGTSS